MGEKSLHAQNQAAEPPFVLSTRPEVAFHLKFCLRRIGFSEGDATEWPKGADINAN
jgi:hypothetical protein